MRILPAPAGTGLRFRLDGGEPFAARAERVVDTRLATVLSDGVRRVSTVEHLLSALNGMGVANATIEVDGPEIPVFDGSAKAYADAVAAVGLREFPEPLLRFAPAEARWFRDGDKLLVILPAASFRVRAAIDFPPPIGVQYHELEVTPETYREQIAASRTFGYRHDAERLLAAGLAKGASPDTAVIFDLDGPPPELRSPNEPVRHKILDLIGDFALLGAYPQCEIVAVKSGHALHYAAVRDLSAADVFALTSAG